MSISKSVRYLLICSLFLLFYIYSASVTYATWSSDSTSNNPVVLNSSSQNILKILPDQTGGAYFLYVDQINNGGIYLQRLNNYGEQIWGSEGILIGKISSWVSASSRLDMINDSSGNVIIVWEEVRQNINRVLAQKININGNTLWDEGGLLISLATSLYAYNPQVVTDKNGGAIITWAYDNAAGSAMIKAQHVSHNGELLWSANGINLTGLGVRERVSRIIPDGNAGAFLLYRGNSNQILLIQHINSNSDRLWSGEGKVLSTNTSGSLTTYGFIADNLGGGYIQWRVAGTSEPRYQRVDNNGTYLWGENAIVFPFSGRIISNYDGDLYVVTNHGLTPSDWDIYLYKIMSDGSMGWSGNYVEIVTKPEVQLLNQLTLDETNGITITWNDQLDPTNTDIYAQRINGDGQILWDEGGVVVTNAPSNQTGAVIDLLDRNNFLVAWTDTRNGNNDIYAQKVNLDGTLGDSPTPTPDKHFELPIAYENRTAGTPEQFKTAFWSRLTAAFDHELEKGIYQPFTSAIYSPKDCPRGVLGITCYDSHNGTDFSAVGGIDIYSVAEGTVLYASGYDEKKEKCIEEKNGEFGAYGCVVLVEYEHPIEEGEYLVGLYGHLSKIEVVDEDLIAVDTKIGEMGKTGCPNCGVHLHFSVLKEVGLSAIVTKQKSLSKRMTEADWKTLLAELPDEDNKKSKEDIFGGSNSNGKAYCTYNAPNGIRFSFVDPSGWRGEDIDPWSLPIDLKKKESGCNISSSYLWKYDIGTGLLD